MNKERLKVIKTWSKCRKTRKKLRTAREKDSKERNRKKLSKKKDSDKKSHVVIASPCSTLMPRREAPDMCWRRRKKLCCDVRGSLEPPPAAALVCGRLVEANCMEEAIESGRVRECVE